MSLAGNLKTDYGAVGDGQMAVDAITISSGSPTVLHTTTALFVSGDVGKIILVDGIGAGGIGLNTTIAAFTSATQVTLADAASTFVTASSLRLAWGTDDFAAFKAFNAAARAVTGLVTLTIPSGIYMNSGSSPTSGDQDFARRWTRGIPQLKVVGVSNPTLCVSDMGAFTFPDSNACMSRVATAKAGDTSVTLLTPGEFTRFQPGRTITQSDHTVYTSGTRCIIAGVDLQGFGDANPHFFEFNTITAVNTSTGQITLANLLKQDYLSTWPLYFAGDGFHPDCGGPATIFMLDASWDADIEHSGYQVFSPGAQINGPARSIKFTNGFKWLASKLGLGPNPSYSLSFTTDNADFTGCFIEVDKCIGTLSVLNGSAGGTLFFQSSSTDDLIVDQSTIGIQGTPKRSLITNSHVTSLAIGAQSYGRTDFVKAVSTQIDFLGVNPANASDVENITSGFACVDGTITSTGGPVSLFVPGTFVIASGQAECGSIFRGNRLSGNGSPAVAATVTTFGTGNSPPSWPPIPLSGGTLLKLLAHPCPSLWFDTCTGNVDVVDLSQAAARGKPIFSYSKRTYTQADLIGTVAQNPRMWGTARSFRVSVDTAYAGASAVTLNPVGQFQGPTINLKQAGTRLFTFGSGWTGAQSGDTLINPGATFPDSWMSGPTGPFSSRDISADGFPVSVTVEFIGDQGMTMVVPMGLRLHA